MDIDPKARDILREYDRYTWTPTHRKDMAMDRETAKTLLIKAGMMSYQMTLEDRLDQLEELGLIDKPKKPNILDEEWELRESKSNITDEYGNYPNSVQTDDGWILAHNVHKDYEDAIGALPDCLRALVAVRDKITWIDTAYHGGSDIVKLIQAALKKAGVS